MRMQVFPRLHLGADPDGYYTIRFHKGQKVLLLDAEGEALVQAALELAVEALGAKLEDDRHMVYPVYGPDEVDAILKDAEQLEELSRKLKGDV